MDFLILMLGALAALANMSVVFAATLRLSARGAAISDDALRSPLLFAMAAVLPGLIASISAIMLVSPAATDLFGATAPPWRTLSVWIALAAGAGFATLGAALVALDLGVNILTGQRRAYTAPQDDAARYAPRESEAVG